MKKLYLIALIVFIPGLLLTTSAQQDTVLVDFGSAAIQSAVPWNNVAGVQVSEQPTPLFNTNIEATPFGIRVNDQFTGTNTAGTTSPDPLLKMPSSATSDSH